MSYQTQTLASGLRIIVRPSSSQVVYCGIAVGAGTRHEQQGEEGLAHFCEHLAFKGTRQRTAVQIINALEGVGGELNAFTTKEDTVYYAITTRQHLRRALDVLADIVFFSQYPQQELEKECEVVCDEIESYEDTPSDLIFDDFENILFQNHPLGHNILGTASQVRTYRQEDACRFARRHYRPDNCVLFVSGDVDIARLPLPLWLVGESVHESACPDARAGIAGAGDGHCDSCPSGELGHLITRHRGTHQAHVMMGTRTFAATDPRRWSLFLLNNILGGPSMSSRLNLSLREHRGLVYTVESQMVTYSDTGLWSVYFGCDPADVRRCLRLVRSELDRLMARPLSEAVLAKAKRQLRGQLAIASENREQFALDMAKVYLHEQRFHTLEYVLDHIDALTAEQLWQTACELFAAERMVTLVYD
jgi:predicted Zn-dependent peptidase